MPMQCYIHVKSQFRGKKAVLPLRNFRLLHYSGILQRLCTTPFYPISSLLSVSRRLREVENKGKVQTFSSKSGRLQEVSNVVIWAKTF